MSTFFFVMGWVWFGVTVFGGISFLVRVCFVDIDKLLRAESNKSIYLIPGPLLWWAAGYAMEWYEHSVRVW
ncbi:MAG TPA: hypothetical protein ENI27_08315 [bacterium]|nr:hypothetical protein [bacterium]